LTPAGARDAIEGMTLAPHPQQRGRDAPSLAASPSHSYTPNVANQNLPQCGFIVAPPCRRMNARAATQSCGRGRGERTVTVRNGRTTGRSVCAQTRSHDRTQRMRADAVARAVAETRANVHQKTTASKNRQPQRVRVGASGQGCATGVTPHPHARAHPHPRVGQPKEHDEMAFIRWTKGGEVAPHAHPLR